MNSQNPRGCAGALGPPPAHPARPVPTPLLQGVQEPGIPASRNPKPRGLGLPEGLTPRTRQGRPENPASLATCAPHSHGELRRGGPSMRTRCGAAAESGPGVHMPALPLRASAAGSHHLTGAARKNQQLPPAEHLRGTRHHRLTHCTTQGRVQGHVHRKRQSWDVSLLGQPDPKS